MEVDTGAAVTLISEETQKKLFSKANLSKSTVKLQTYTAEPLHVLGTQEVQVRYGNYVGKHNLYVIKGNGPSLFGRDWLSKIIIDWQNLRVTNNIQSKSLSLQAGIAMFELGKLKGYKAKLTVKAHSKVSAVCLERCCGYRTETVRGSRGYSKYTS